MLQNRNSRPNIAVIFLVMLLPSTLLANSFFKLEPVEYFQLDKKKPFKKKEKILDWPKTTPTVVIKLLDDPSPANAQAYLDWQQKKMDQIKKAQEAVTRLIEAPTK
jgi:hypothetical protein